MSGSRLVGWVVGWLVGRLVGWLVGRQDRFLMKNFENF